MSNWYDENINSESIVVVIDVLRATSVISTAFHYGVKEIIPVQSLEEAKNYQGKENHIVAAERNAMPIDGFDFGNSPFHYMNDKVKDKTLVLTTTNGTKALEIATNRSTRRAERKSQARIMASNGRTKLRTAGDTVSRARYSSGSQTNLVGVRQ